MKELKHEDIRELLYRAFNKELPAGAKLLKTETSVAAEPLASRQKLSNIIEVDGRKFQKRTTLVHHWELIEEYWELP